MEFRTWKSVFHPGLRANAWSGEYWDNITYFVDANQFFLITHGSGQFHFNQTATTDDVTTDDVVFVKAHQAHNGHPAAQKAWGALTIEIDAALFDVTLAITGDVNAHQLPTGKMRAEDRDRLRPLLAQLTQEIQDGDDALAEQVLLASCLDVLRESIAPISQVVPATSIDKAIDFLKAHYTEQVDLDQLAGVCAVSKFHLLRSFKLATGLPPHLFQTQLRLTSARKKLLQGTAPLDIALELGFSDQAHFIRTFKKYASISPGKYQKSHAALLRAFGAA
jgi:AraC-like DNA-binding protein